MDRCRAVTNRRFAAQSRVRAPRSLCKSVAHRRTRFDPVTVCKSVAHDLAAGRRVFLHIRRSVPFVELACAAPIAMLYFPHMAAKKTTLESLAKLISESSASADKKFAALAEDIADIKSTMVTKDDLAAVESRLDGRIDKLDAKIDRIDTKLTKFEENEIDKRLQLEVRVSTIEKHLALDKKIAA
jgi:septal ring factor EnvC (AmiA/AmiB activator)